MAIVFTSGWGVSTGVGQAGRTHSTIERSGDDPVVRGTVITGVLRERVNVGGERPCNGPAEENRRVDQLLPTNNFGQDPTSDRLPTHVTFSSRTRPAIPARCPYSIEPDHRDGALPVPALHGARGGRHFLQARSSSSTRPRIKDSIQRTTKAPLPPGGCRPSWSGMFRACGSDEVTILVTNREL